ncbi:MAG: hypothetical protein KKA19_02885 [Candidatus Margulisbacteria bacterium]|nr:hypothetical protein [Candidatus Margulisiibacteriota bacterium]
MKKKGIFLKSILIIFILEAFCLCQNIYNSLEIEDFKANTSRQYNRLSANHGLVIQKPSDGSLRVENNQAVINYQKESGNYIGFYTNLFKKHQSYIDLSKYDDLEIIGNFPDDKYFFVALAELDSKNSPGKETLIPLYDFFKLDNRYLLPLSSIPEVDLSKLAVLRIYAHTSGTGNFTIEKIIFYDYNEPKFETSEPGEYLIDHFNDSTNHFGNKDIKYEYPPAKISIKRLPQTKDQTDRCLKISADNLDKGWSIYANPLLREKSFTIMNTYKTLLFKARGEKGGEDPVIAFSDRNPSSKEMVWAAGKISEFSGTPLSTKWREIQIPLSAFGPISDDQIKEFLIIMPDQQQTTIYLDDLRLSTREYLEKQPISNLAFLIHSFNSSFVNDLGNTLQSFAEPPSKLSIKRTLHGAQDKDNPCL